MRRRLLGFVLASILLAATALGIATYRNALREADAMFDLHLQQMAHSLRGGIPAGTPADNTLGEEGFDITIQIWRPDGTQVFRSAQSVLPPRAVLGFSDATAGGNRYRVYSLETPLQIVQIAQDMGAREDRAQGLALRAILPMALMAPLLMLAVGLIITRSLAPVERMRRQVATRADDDLSPLPEAGLPIEVRPLVQELNGLFRRVDSAFAAQKNFVADAAHELRSPLTALRLQAEALQRAATETDRDTAIVRLQQGIERAIRLVAQMLVLARQEASPKPNMPPGDGPEAMDEVIDVSAPPDRVEAVNAMAMADEAAPVDVDAVVREVIEAALPQANARRIDLGLVASTPLMVQGQAAALQILFGNLIDNAIKYTPEGGQVDVTVALTGGHPTVLLEDSGPGMAPAARARAFDRFFRAGEGDAGGSGLGLSIVATVAERHGASVQLGSSERLGGLQVEVRFPRSA